LSLFDKARDCDGIHAWHKSWFTQLLLDALFVRPVREAEIMQADGSIGFQLPEQGAIVHAGSQSSGE
jgi:hypothetical protein